MILIPELQTVVILVPRTGSGALRRAVAARYPKSMLVYRHMEADGVPQGYDRWQKVGVVRHPVDRLWSLYKFLKNFGGAHDPDFIASMRHSVFAMTFSEWLVHNRVVFTSPYDRAGRGRFFPEFTVRHPLPENEKSQFVYLRPDLGTQIYQYNKLHELHKRLDVSPAIVNATWSERPPELTGAAQEYVDRWFAWDLAAVIEPRAPSAAVNAPEGSEPWRRPQDFNPDLEGRGALQEHAR